MNESFLPRDFFVNDIRDNFTRVNIEGVRRVFIKQDWKYVYTLNIDDGIERANQNLSKVLPYRELDKKAQDINLLYKIHGCANEEIIYNEKNKLIFSEKQYLRSLTQNEHVLTALKNDMMESNLLYLGCSLDRELDIMYAISGVTEDKLINSKRIYVTKELPDEIALDTLEEYGVNVVALLDNYDEIYHLVNECFALRGNDELKGLDEFSSRHIYALESLKNKNITYMLQGEIEEEGRAKSFSVPYYIAERDILKEVSEGISKNQAVIIKGRRFSGKSLLLKLLTTKVKTRRSFYFPSISSLNSNDIQIMATIKNTVYFIDSNVITFLEATTIRRLEKDLKDNNTSFIIACNPTELDVANVFSNSEKEDDFFELSNFFSTQETSRLNYNLSSLGIIEWKENINVLENTFYSAGVYPEIKQKIYIQRKISDTELKLLILLAVLDKVYISLSREIGIGNEESTDMVNKYSPILEVVPTNDFEKNHKSRYKIVANSKAWILELISGQYSYLGASSINNIIIGMIKLFLRNKQYEDIGKKLIMFDTVNQLFSRKNGAGKLILSLYEELQPVLSHEPDYWLQRAKAMGKVLNRTESLIDAIDFAKKAYEDGKRTKTVLNAEFTLCNLYGKLCDKSNYGNAKFISEALFWYSSAIRNNSHNSKYINSMLEVTKDNKGSLYSLCKNIIALQIKLNSEDKRMFNEIYKFINAV